MKIFRVQVTLPDFKVFPADTIKELTMRPNCFAGEERKTVVLDRTEER